MLLDNLWKSGWIIINRIQAHVGYRQRHQTDKKKMDRFWLCRRDGRGFKVGALVGMLNGIRYGRLCVCSIGKSNVGEVCGVNLSRNKLPKQYVM